MNGAKGRERLAYFATAGMGLAASDRRKSITQLVEHWFLNEILIMYMDDLLVCLFKEP